MQIGRAKIISINSCQWCLFVSSHSWEWCPCRFRCFMTNRDERSRTDVSGHQWSSRLVRFHHSILIFSLFDALLFLCCCWTVTRVCVCVCRLKSVAFAEWDTCKEAHETFTRHIEISPDRFLLEAWTMVISLLFIFNCRFLLLTVELFGLLQPLLPPSSSSFVIDTHQYALMTALRFMSWRCHDGNLDRNEQTYVATILFSCVCVCVQWPDILENDFLRSLALIAFHSFRPDDKFFLLFSIESDCTIRMRCKYCFNTEQTRSMYIFIIREREREEKRGKRAPPSDSVFVRWTRETNGRGQFRFFSSSNGKMFCAHLVFVIVRKHVRKSSSLQLS